MDTWQELWRGAERYLLSLLSCKPIVFLLSGILAIAGRFCAQAPEAWRILGAAAMFLFVSDFGTGVAKSMLIDRQRLSSSGIGRTLIKAYVYLSLVLLCVVLDMAARTGYSAQLAILGFVVIREGKSNLENLSALEPITGIRIPSWLGMEFDRLEKDKPGKGKGDGPADH